MRSHEPVFNEDMPVYFRVDLLRAIIGDYLLRHRETQFFVYGDIDMIPLSARELFDKKTVGFLNEYGFVMAKGGFLGFENGFQILNGEHPQFMDSHRKVIVDLSLNMALEEPRDIGEQQIYDTYRAMVAHFFDADGRYGPFCFHTTPKDEAEKLRWFRFDSFKNHGHLSGDLTFAEGEINLRTMMPRKPVRLPPSHFG